MKISLCMIVKDEEEVLARCLDSASDLVDEIVIADTGSTDKTTEIAHTYTEFLYKFPWEDDFAKARNFAFSKATGDYLLWLDADDIVSPSGGTKEALLSFLERGQPDLVYCPYRVGGGCVFERERLVLRTGNFQWQGRVHECIPPHGKTARYPLTVEHLGSKKIRGERNLRIYRKWAKEERLSARDLFYYGRELFYGGYYPEAAAALEEMLKEDGWYVNKIEACKYLALTREQLGDWEGAVDALTESFRFGEPRAALLCELGRLFRIRGRLREAAFWYESALSCRDHTAEGDFEQPDCRGIIPVLELVFCCYRIGEREKAAFYHKKSEELAPAHPSVLYNRQFFS